MAKKNHSLIILGVFLLLVVVIVVAMFLKRYREGFDVCASSGCSASGSKTVTVAATSITGLTSYANNYSAGYTNVSVAVDVGTISCSSSNQSASITAVPTITASTGSISIKYTGKVTTKVGSTSTNGVYYNCNASPKITVTMAQPASWGGKSITLSGTTYVYAQLYVPNSGSSYTLTMGS